MGFGASGGNQPAKDLSQPLANTGANMVVTGADGTVNRGDGTQIYSPNNNALPAGISPNLAGLNNWMNNNTAGNINAGLGFSSKYFGNNNPAIANIEAIEQQKMRGMTPDQIGALRDQGTSQINSQVGTGLHALAGMNSANHVAGGAAAAGAMPLLNNANIQQAQLANNINLQNIAQQNQALGQYQSTVTGERAGQLNTGFGIAGLGQANTAGAMQYGLGQDYLNWAQNNLGANPGPGPAGDSPSGPLGAPGNSFGGKMKDGFGRPVFATGNDASGMSGALATGLQGGNPTTNTPLDPNFYKNLDTNPGDLANSNVVNPFKSAANPQNWGF